MKIITTLLISTSIFAMSTAFSAPSSKKETIVVEGKLGTIKEQRVKSVQSSISFVPAGGTASYELIDISDNGANGMTEHVEAEEITIPSWTLFSW
ncbi:MAG: hypothetical protein V3U78_05315 [Thiotrichaceae bacterium]